jgi:hypothetical protein
MVDATCTRSPRARSAHTQQLRVLQDGDLLLLPPTQCGRGMSELSVKQHPGASDSCTGRRARAAGRTPKRARQPDAPHAPARVWHVGEQLHHAFVATVDKQHDLQRVARPEKGAGSAAKWAGWWVDVSCTAECGSDGWRGFILMKTQEQGCFLT